MKLLRRADHALHVMFLVLHRPEEYGIGQVDHLRHAAPLRPEENPLAFGRAVDDVVGRTEIFADQFRFVLIEGPLQVRGEKAVLDVHAGRQAQLRHAAQDERLIGGLLRVFAEQDDPSGVERAIDVVMPAVHVQRVLGQRPRDDLQHHRRALAWGVVVLFDAVHDSLARREINDTFSAHRVRDSAALSGVFAFGFDGHRAAAEDIQAAFSEGLLVEFAPFGGGRDRVENASIGDACFGVVGDELVAVCGDPYPRIARSGGHKSLRVRAPPTEVSVDCFVYILGLATRTRNASFIGSG